MPWTVAVETETDEATRQAILGALNVHKCQPAMEMAEDEARRRGCTGSLQAPGGRIPDYVAGQDRNPVFKRFGRRRRLPDYVHGYDAWETERLRDQAGTLVDLLHADTVYPPGSTVLEAGCGVGAQTVTLATRSPGARFTSVDISADSVAAARRRVEAAGLANVVLRQADIFALPFPAAAFDHVFVCFVLEHLLRPDLALAALLAMLKPGGSMTVVEGDHGSAYFHPDDAAARAVVDSQVELQRRAGGNALIGRQLYPLLAGAGLSAVQVSPRLVYVDASKPGLVEGFIRKTFTAMIEGVRGPAIAAGLVGADLFDAGVRALNRTAEPDGVFCYTFFKGFGIKPRG